MYIIRGGKNQQRASHWNDIRSRVITHEGEALSGEKGRQYQEKYGERYLGMKPSKPVEAKDVEQHEIKKAVQDKQHDSTSSTKQRSYIYTGK